MLAIKEMREKGKHSARTPPVQHNSVFTRPRSPASFIQMETYFYKAPITFHFVFSCVADYFQSYGCYSWGLSHGVEFPNLLCGVNIPTAVSF